MRSKRLSLAAAAIFSLAMGGSAIAASSSNADIKGTYNCQLSGSFAINPFSNVQMQFQVDGAGNVVATNPGELSVVLGGIDTLQNQSPPLTYSNTFSYQSCQYTVAAGSTYQINKNGAGTMQINWTPNANNAASPTDCTPAITTNFNVLVNAKNSLSVMSTDLAGNCNAPANYANCGSSLVGICQLQSPRP